MEDYWFIEYNECENCGCTDCEERINPFIEEVYGIKERQYLCDDCYEEAIESI